MPGLRGFSATNIKNMRSFYEEWSPFVNRQPMADEFNWANFVAIGFSHHIEIITKAKSLTKSTYYINKVKYSQHKALTDTTQNPLQPLSLHSQYIAATFTAHRRSVQNTSYEFISMIINYLRTNHTNYSSPCREKSLPTCSLHASLHG